MSEPSTYQGMTERDILVKTHTEVSGLRKDFNALRNEVAGKASKESVTRVWMLIGILITGFITISVALIGGVG